MPNISKRQASFSRLATGHSSSRRSDIMLAATDAFCCRERPVKAQIDQFKELFYSLIAETDESAKRLIANALARHYYTPRAILMYLSLENAAIAAPILAYSKGLGQFDLLQIIEKTSPLHHRVIANRDDLGKTVIATLADLGDQQVIQKLMDNPDADVSELKQSAAPINLATAEVDAKDNSGNQKVVVDALAEMNSILFDGAKNKEATRKTAFAENNASPDLTESLRKPGGENKIKVALDELITLANRGQRLGSVEDLLVDVPKAPALSFEQQLLDATMRKHRQDQVSVIRKEFELNASSAHAVFEDHSGDTLAVTLNAANVDDAIALQIITLSIPNVGLSPHNTQRMTKIYPALNQLACLETVKTWSNANAGARHQHKPTSVETEFKDSRSAARPIPGRQPMPSTRTHKLFGTR